MNHSDFNFRKSLNDSKNKSLTESLNRIDKIARSNFTPVNPNTLKLSEENIATKIIDNITSEEKGVLPWLIKSTLVVTTVAGLFAGLGTLYNALKDWFSGRSALRHETEKIRRAKETDKGAKEFFDWLPKSKTFSQMQRILRELQASGGMNVTQKNNEITKQFIEEVKGSRLSPAALSYIAKELKINPQYLQTGVKYGSSSAVLSGVGSQNEPTSMEQVESKTVNEVSPPSGPARRFSKKPEVKAAFKKKYGDRWKEVMYATAWKMHKK